MWQVLEPQKEGLRQRLARSFGCDPEEIAITRNASEGLQICQFGFDLELGDPPGGETAERVRSAPSETSLREAEVIAVAEAYLRALSDRDGAKLRALSLPGGSVHAVDLADDGSLWRIRSRSLEDDAVTIAEDSDPLLERMWDPIAMVHGPLAMVWTPYDFWVAGEWSHCGVDIFTLVETDDGWKVSSISYTSEVADCPESPLPPPTAEELGIS
jgi:hypothetical protein